MTKDQQIKEIREKCIEANSEIVELKFGCVVTHPRFGLGYATEKPDDRNIYSILFPSYERGYTTADSTDSRHRDVQFEIIGRPIRLADVLLVLDNKLPSGSWITACGHLCFHESDIDDELFVWNLHKDNLTEQSEETITFIHQLICK